MADWKNHARDEFDHWSRTYDRSVLQKLFFAPSHRLLIDNMADLAGPLRILDVGCGTGNLMGKLAERFPEAKLHGLDISEGMLAKAARKCRRLGERVQLKQGDGERLPYADDRFDVVACVHSFHHYPDKAGSLHEMHRVLRPGGRLLLLDANRDGLWGLLVFQGLVRAIERTVHHCTQAEYRTLLAGSGFAEVTQPTGGRTAPFLLNRATASPAAGRRSQAA